jgi:hypothetical protein
MGTVFPVGEAYSGVLPGMRCETIPGPGFCSDGSMDHRGSPVWRRARVGRRQPVVVWPRSSRSSAGEESLVVLTTAGVLQRRAASNKQIRPKTWSRDVGRVRRERAGGCGHGTTRKATGRAGASRIPEQQRNGGEMKLHSWCDGPQRDTGPAHTSARPTDVTRCATEPLLCPSRPTSLGGC